MELEVLLDSVILIDHFNGIREATEYLRDCRGRAAVSAITRAEVLTGYGFAGRDKAVDLLNVFPTLIVDADIADLAAEMRRTARWKLPDAIQAALAEYHGLRLITRNSRDFPPTRFPFVDIPYTVNS